MAYTVLVEHLLSKAEAVGPFEHEEEARRYAERKVTGNVWRIVELKTPEKD